MEIPNLGTFNLFIGPNNAGKSNLFRILFGVTEDINHTHEGLYWDIKTPLKQL